MKGKKTILATVTNALVGAIVLSLLFVRAEASSRYSTFIFFTTDSNLLAAFCCLLLALYEGLSLKGRKVPHWVLVMKHVGTVSVALTFLTVMVFLGPAYGYRSLLTGTEFYYHLFCPVAAMVSFLFLDPQAEKEMSFPMSLVGMVPMAVYGIVYFTEVVLIGRTNGGWPDVYGFTRNGMTYVSMSSMVLGTFLISTLLWLGRKKWMGRQEA